MNINNFFPWAVRRYLKKIARVPDMWNTLIQLKENNFSPDNIFDIGAFKGEWTKNCYKIFPNSNYFLFEPQEEFADLLKLMETDYLISENLFLGEDDGTRVEFFQAGTSSSALRFGPHAPIEKHTTSLDSYCRTKSINNIDILKLDVQGYELNILSGARSILNNVELIIAEVSLIDVYVNCPLANDVIQFLNDNQFQLFDIVDYKRRELDNHLWQCDMFFVKKDSNLLIDKRKDENQMRPE